MFRLISTALLALACCVFQSGCCCRLLPCLFQGGPPIVVQPPPPQIVVEQPDPFKDQKAPKEKKSKEGGKKDANPPKEFPNKDFPGTVAPGNGKIILNQQGRLSPNDAKLGEKPVKTFTIRLEQNREYVIDMMSDENAGGVDSFLRLKDAFGKLVKSDDDSGGGPNGHNARIRYRAPQTGNYTIEATCFSFVPQDGGIFFLTVRDEG
jgi:hypothetical protein